MHGASIPPMPTAARPKPAALESDLRQTLATNVRSLRRTLSLSQEDVAELSGLHRTYVGSVERCERNVSLSTLVVLARALGVTVPQLLAKADL